MSDYKVPYPVRHYEVTTLLEALSLTIVDMLPRPIHNGNFFRR